MKNDRVKPKVGNVLFNILAIITVISVGFVAFNLLSGAKGYAVTSDSMAETLHRGDLVFSKKPSSQSLMSAMSLRSAQRSLMNTLPTELLL